MTYVDSVIHTTTKELSYQDFVAIREKLTLRYPKSEEVVELFTYDEATQQVTLPRSMASLFGNACDDHMTDGRRFECLKSNFVPREGQEAAIQALVKAMSVGTYNFGHAILDADCGLGKTVMASEAILRIGRSAVVLVHKEFLANQWVEAFHGNPEKGIVGLWPEAKIGFIQQDRCDSGADHDIVIAVVQSLTGKRQYPQEVLDSFGILVGDEVHRYGAGVWQKALKLFPARRRLGLTATWWRHDGMLPVIENHISGPTHSMRRENVENSRVHFVKVNTVMERNQYINVWNGELNRGRMVTGLSQDKGRNRFIATMIGKALAAGRKVIVLSERREQLSDLEVLLTELGWVDKCGYYVGGRTQDQLEDAAEKACVLATYQMAKEGLDVPRLDTLFIATPIADVVQSVGRIMRSSSEKKEPVVIDFVDYQIGPCVGLSKARHKQYVHLGFSIE